MFSRQQTQQPFEGRVGLPLRGINIATQEIGQDECRDAINFWLSEYGNLESRPGTVRITNSPGNGPVKGIYFSEALGKLLVAAGTNLYLVADDGAVTTLGALAGEAPKVSMIDFVGKVYIASGTGLQCYDGTSLSTVVKAGTTDVPNLLYLVVFGDRLWGCEDNSRVAWSGVRSATDWGGGADLTGGYVFVRDGDGAKISGLCLYQGGLLVAKSTSLGTKVSTWKVTGATPAEFAVTLISEGVGSICLHAMDRMMNDAIFAGNGGVYSYVMTQEYQYPQAFPLSLKVRPMYDRFHPTIGRYHPRLGMYFLGTQEGAIFVYHSGAESWWRWTFSGFDASYLATGKGDVLLIGGSNGHVYRLDQTRNVWTDDGTAYVMMLLSRVFDLDSPLRRKWLSWFYVDFLPFASGMLGVDYRRGYGLEYQFSTVFPTETTEVPAGWDGSFRWDTNGIGWDQGTVSTVRDRIGIQGDTIQFQFAATAPLRLIGMGLEGGVLWKRPLGWRH